MSNEKSIERASNKVTRRRMLQGLGMATGALMLDMGLPRPLKAGNTAGQATSMAQAEEVKRPWYDLGIIGDSLMDQRLLWYLSATWQDMADIGECLETASRIKAEDISSWWQEWLKTAERVRGYGDKSLAWGHKISAGEAYLRASNYYRAALMYYAEPEDPELLEATKKSAACFDKAIELLSIPAQPVKIPYEDTTLPGYFFRSPIADEKAPLLIVFEGWDAWPEETKYLADGAVKRGYHCLQFHGPGQGRALREQGLTYRPDWENVVAPVVDFAISQPGVDPERIALMGISFGGALATRAVAFEKRIKICISNPAVLSWADVIYGIFLTQYPQLLQLLEADPEAFNAAVWEFVKEIPAYNWWFKATMWKHGATSPADLMIKLKDFTNVDIVDKVTCQVLIMDGEAEDWSVGQAKKVYDALSCPKEYMLFTAEDTGLVHCQTGALAIASQRMFDWLDEHI
ncbi:MAG: alpha/beta hydrolase family protein [Anaerolineae bacterium]